MAKFDSNTYTQKSVIDDQHYLLQRCDSANEFRADAHQLKLREYSISTVKKLPVRMKNQAKKKSFL